MIVIQWNTLIMKHVKENRKNLLFILFHFSSVLFVFAVFLKSYFPSKSAVPGYSDKISFPEVLRSSADQQNHVGELKPLYGRLVFILIDALRVDFVTDKKSPMSFVAQVLEQNQALAFIAKANPPTVTLPRIKALTTGGIPGFVDVVLNFGSSSLQEDNLVTQMKRNRRRIVFYGDDTWLQLFPEHFDRSDGTTSFFVTDYTEVDDNVTRHLENELKEADFDTLILHYLGLDHIGHLAGPKSPLVKPKLQEMDGIVQYIHHAVEQYNSSLPTLIMLCGDHGMSDQGSHGGASISETLVPVVYITPNHKFVKNRRQDDLPSYPEIDQIDVVPTLSVLLGLPIPQNNLGKLIDEMLDGYTIEDKLLAWHTNAYQVLQVFKQNLPNFEQEPAFLAYERTLESHHNWLHQMKGNLSSVTFNEVGGRISQQYKDVIMLMSSKLSSSLTQYDMYGLFVSIYSLLVILIVLLLQQIQVHLVLHWTSTVFILIGFLFGHMTVCTSQSGKGSSLCRFDILSFIQQSGLAIIVVWFTSCLLSFVARFPPAKVMCLKVKKLDTLTSCFVLGTILHTVSLGSSSFVEEEHQTWYFFTVTIHFIIIIRTLKAYSNQYMKRNQINISENNSSLTYANGINIKKIDVNTDAEFEFRSDIDSVDSMTSKNDGNSFANDKLIGHKNKQADGVDIRIWEHCRYYKSIIFGCVSVLVLCRILRTWNQTGDKWLNIPDIGDWLVRPENKPPLSLSVIVSMTLMSIIQCRNMSKYQVPVFVCSLMSIYWYRAVSGAVVSPVIKDQVSKGVMEARLGFTTITIFVLQSFLTLLKQKPEKIEKNISLDFIISLHKSWILLMTLLVRPHNIPMVAMVTIQEFIISRYILSNMKLPVTSLTLYYLWMGRASYFYQGNSNSISTVDVSAGYIGLDDYQPVIVAVLLCLSTYAGIIFWLLSLVKMILTHYIPSSTDTASPERLNSLPFSKVCSTLLLCRVLPLSFYEVIVTVQRYHLFVWTVFSPKLLYEGMTSIVEFIFCTLLLILNF